MNFASVIPALVTEIPTTLLDGLSITSPQVLKNKQAYFAVYENELNVKNNIEQIQQLAPLDVVVTSLPEYYDLFLVIFGHQMPVLKILLLDLTMQGLHRIDVKGYVLPTGSLDRPISIGVG